MILHVLMVVDAKYFVKTADEVPVIVSSVENVSLREFTDITNAVVSHKVAITPIKGYWESDENLRSINVVNHRASQYTELMQSFFIPTESVKRLRAPSLASLSDGSLHALSYHPFALHHFSNHYDSYTTTDLNSYSNIGIAFTNQNILVSLKQLNSMLVLSVTDQTSSKFYARITNGMRIGCLFVKYDQKTTEKNGATLDLISEQPIELVMDRFADTNNMVVFAPKQGNKFFVTVFGEQEVTVHTITTPFQFTSIKWIAPSVFLLSVQERSSLVQLMIQFDQQTIRYSEVDVALGNNELYDANVSMTGSTLYESSDPNLIATTLSYVNTMDQVSVQKYVSQMSVLPSMVHYLRHSNQLVITEEQTDNSPSTISVLNFKRNSVRKLVNTGSTPQSIIDILELPNGNIATLHSNYHIQIWDTNIERVLREAAFWLKYNATMEEPTQIEINYRSNTKGTSFPKHGQDTPNNDPHVGGNTYAGGTGGRDTAGLGGVGGPYRLDKGHTVYQIPDQEKAKISKEALEAAQKMGQEAYRKRLQEIEMSHDDMSSYLQFKNQVALQVKQLREILAAMQWKDEEEERKWMKHQSEGELDESKIVEGITGERLIYKRRANVDQKEQDYMPPQFFEPKKPKLLHFVLDVSASMYRFNGVDQRLYKMMEIAVLIMESTQGFEKKFIYRITGHSGQTSDLILVDEKKPPLNEKERLKVILKMHAHAQFCLSGDSTIEALHNAIKRCEEQSTPGNESYVFAFSDANMQRYGIYPQYIKKVMSEAKRSQCFLVFIASMFNEAIEIKKELHGSNTFVCLDTKQLAPVFKQMLSSSVLKI
jgi:hypothetical protein